jgi:hypothetical protein
MHFPLKMDVKMKEKFPSQIIGKIKKMLNLETMLGVLFSIA